MIVINPANLAIPEQKRSLERFYVDLLNSMGVRVSGVSISPFVGNGDFEVQQAAAGTADKIRNIGNDAVGNLDFAGIGVDPKKSNSFFHGSLSLTTYARLNTAASLAYNATVCMGDNSNLQSYLYQKRNLISVGGDDTFVNGMDNSVPPVFRGGFLNQWDSVVFSYLRITSVQTGAGNSAILTDYMFNGVKIDY